MSVDNKMKLNSIDRRTLRVIAIVVLLIIVIAVFVGPKTSMYQPAPVKIEPVSEESLTTLKSSPDCLNASVYSTSTGGVCGGQKLVRDHASYKIVA